ncbi:ATP cone domain-containing protein, partial [Thiolapillus sp.]|uniref:ATP cone domain-containing protein n=1 Tax=Thiolapillus sp. TaxID=2017437 RepID=UPI0025E67AF0
MKTIKRNGQVVEFDATKIEDAVKNCILDAEGLKAPGATVDAANNSRIHEIARRIATLVVDTLKRRDRENVHIEDIQDQVELALMREGHHQYARA